MENRPATASRDFAASRPPSWASTNARSRGTPPGRRRGRTVTANAREIRAEGHSEIASVVRRDTSLIVNRWAERAAEEQPSARRVHHDVLLDHLPELLAEVANALADA